MTQFDRHKIIFHSIPKHLVAENISWHNVQCLLRKWDKWMMKDKVAGLKRIYSR